MPHVVVLAVVMEAASAAFRLGDYDGDDNEAEDLELVLLRALQAHGTAAANVQDGLNDQEVALKSQMQNMLKMLNQAPLPDVPEDIPQPPVLQKTVTTRLVADGRDAEKPGTSIIKQEIQSPDRKVLPSQIQAAVGTATLFNQQMPDRDVALHEAPDVNLRSGPISPTDQNAADVLSSISQLLKLGDDGSTDTVSRKSGGESAATAASTASRMIGEEASRNVAEEKKERETMATEDSIIAIATAAKRYAEAKLKNLHATSGELKKEASDVANVLKGSWDGASAKSATKIAPTATSSTAHR